MKKVLIVLLLTICVLMGAFSPATAKGFLGFNFSKNYIESTVKNMVRSRINQSEYERRWRHEQDLRNARDIARNRTEIQMRAERNAAARHEREEELLFKQEMERKLREDADTYNNGVNRGQNEEVGAVVLCDPRGQYKVEGYDGVFTSKKAVLTYAQSIFGKDVVLMWDKVEDLSVRIDRD